MERKEMKKTLLSLLLVVLCLVCFASLANALTYYSNTNPGTTKPPAAPWNPMPAGGVEFPGTIGGKIWLGKTNLYVATNQKAWTIEIQGSAYNKYGVTGQHGYKNDGTEPGFASVTGITDDAAQQKRRITITFTPQPAYEVVEITRTAKEMATADSLKANSHST